MEYPDLDIILKVVDLSYSLDIYVFYESLKKYEIETWVNNAGLGDFSLVSKENLSKIEKITAETNESIIKMYEKIIDNQSKLIKMLCDEYKIKQYDFKRRN